MDAHLYKDDRPKSKKGMAVPEGLEPTPQSHPAHLENDNALNVGDRYYIAGGRRAVVLAHSSHRILGDPHHSTNSLFPTVQRRILFRVGNHPLREAFKQGMSDSICNIVQYANLPWTSVGAFRQGFSASAGENVPTVLIMITPMPVSTETYRTAQKLANDIESLLAKRHLNDVHVEIAMMDCAEAYASDEPVVSSGGLANMHDPVWPGNSVGPAGQAESGTLTGCVRIENPTSAVVAGKGSGPRADVFGLTCHHVVGAGRENALAAITEADCVAITSPSAADHDYYAAELHAMVQYCQDNLTEAEETKTLMEMMGKQWPAWRENRMHTLAKDLATHRAILEHVQSCWQQGCQLGTVLLSSGVRLPSPDESMADWAVFQLHTPRMQRQKDSEPAGFIISDYQRLVWRALRTTGIQEKDVFNYFLTPESAWLGTEPEQVVAHDEISLLLAQEAPTYVYLRGRMTPFGIGILHDVCENVHSKYRTKDGEFTVVSRELTILDVPSHQHDLSQPANYVTCSVPGDSGAKVRLADGRVVGVVVASNRNDPLGRPSTHITVAQTLLDRIQSATGASRVSFVAMDEAI